MFNVKDYLNKFKKLSPPDDSLKKYIKKLIKKEINVTIDKKLITIQNKIIYIQVPVIIKTEIFLKKQTLLTKIREFSKTKQIKDIR